MATTQLRRRHVVVVAGLLAAASMAVPAAADGHGGTVPGTVTVAAAAEACLLVDATEVDFGTLEFGGSSTAPDEWYGVTSCSGATQDLLVAGTDATGDDGAAWSLLPFLPDTNAYYLRVYFVLQVGEGFPLMTAPQQLETQLPANESGLVFHDLEMPTAGSDGAGQVMTFDIVWTAVLAD
jgi:hypothetical protein